MNKIKSSYPQTDEPNNFPEIEIGSNRVTEKPKAQIRFHFSI